MLLKLLESANLKGAPLIPTGLTLSSCPTGDYYSNCGKLYSDNPSWTCSTYEKECCKTCKLGEK